MTTLENTERIQNEIVNGSKFNGVVYGKNNGKNWVTLFIYLDGKFTKLEEVSKEISTEKKKEYESKLGVLTSNGEMQKTWIVNGKTTTNMLSYSEMVNKYGIGNFE